MDDLIARFRELDELETPDLRGEARRRVPSIVPVAEPPRRRRPTERILAVALAFLVFGAAVTLGLRALQDEPPSTPRPAVAPWSWAGEGWTELPAPPEWRDGAAIVWTDERLLLWGGCDDSGSDCARTGGGWEFDPASRSWDPLPEAPVAAGFGSIPIWTGEEALFLGIGERGVAYDPTARRWREVAAAPFTPHVAAWTGRDVIAIRPAEPRKDLPVAVAAYDPAADTWRDLPEPPITFTGAVARWTDPEVVVLASHLDAGRRALTPTVQALALDPITATWRELSPSALYPQSFEGQRIGDRVLAWDFNQQWQLLDPASGSWSAPERIPLDFQECYTDGARVGAAVFLFYCGDAALYDRGWHVVRGGPLEETIYSEAYERDLDLWRFADLVSVGDMVVLFMEGLTLDDEGVACYGCSGSPVSYWVYRPSAELPTLPPEHAADRVAALDVASEFMDARILGAEGRIEHLASRDVVGMFERVVPEPMLAGTDYTYDRRAIVPVGDGTSFEVTMTIRFAGPLGDELGLDSIEEILTVGPGTTIAGDQRPLVVTAIRPA
jgi:hypothetical protein